MWFNLSASRGIIAALIPRRACEKEILQSLLVLQGFFPPARKDTRGYLIEMSSDARATLFAACDKNVIFNAYPSNFV